MEAQLPDGQPIDLSVGEGMDNIEKTLSASICAVASTSLVFGTDGILSELEGASDGRAKGIANGLRTRRSPDDGL
jgi:two-component system sensor histidine kinase ChvG